MSNNEKKLNFWIKLGRGLISGGDSCGKTGKILATAAVVTLTLGYVLTLGADLAHNRVKKYKRACQIKKSKKA